MSQALRKPLPDNLQKILVTAQEIAAGPPPPHLHFFVKGQPPYGLIAFLKKKGIETDRIISAIRDGSNGNYMIYYVPAQTDG